MPQKFAPYVRPSVLGCYSSQPQIKFHTQEDLHIHTTWSWTPLCLTGIVVQKKLGLAKHHTFVKKKPYLSRLSGENVDLKSLKLNLEFATKLQRTDVSFNQYLLSQKKERSVELDGSRSIRGGTHLRHRNYILYSIDVYLVMLEVKTNF